MLMVMSLATASVAQQPPSVAQQPSPPQQSGPAQPWSKVAGTDIDRFFVQRSAQAGLAEIELAKLASRKAQHEDVKKFALQMADDHNHVRTDLRRLALQKYIPWPSFLSWEYRALRDRLSRLNGANFDRAYVQAIVDGHRTLANELRAESQAGKDPEVRAWAAKILPSIEAHLRHAEGIQRSVGTPGPGQHAAR
jgi:putative membrane protein